MTISTYAPNCITCKKKLQGMNCFIYENGIPQAVLFNPPEENAKMGLPCDGASMYEYSSITDKKRVTDGNSQISG